MIEYWYWCYTDSVWLNFFYFLKHTHTSCTLRLFQACHWSVLHTQILYLFLSLIRTNTLTQLLHCCMWTDMDSYTDIHLQTNFRIHTKILVHMTDKSRYTQCFLIYNTDTCTWAKWWNYWVSLVKLLIFLFMHVYAYLVFGLELYT